jgi:2-dehydro-3-deoxygluconokinase
MPVLDVKPADSCKYDMIALGEIMLRLDPGDGRVRTARDFKVWEGGGEYNVARGLRRCFGYRTSVVTAFADNEVGRLVEDFILQGGVDVSLIQWRDYDGIGRSVRNGLNFTERGFGVRGAVGVPDRGNTAASIYGALSESTAEVIEEAVQTAKKYGTIVSYDLNYRPSLWQTIGGHAKAQEVNRGIAKYVDVMIGNEEDFTACLGFEVEGVDENISKIEIDAFKRMIETAVADFPNFKVTATTLRAVKSATVNDWSAICWADGNFYESQKRPEMEIFDRVGGGDSFASGLIYGLMHTGDPQVAVEYGAAHGALAMTTPGDTSMVTVKDVEKLASGGGARVVR